MVPACQSNVATCPPFPTIARCLDWDMRRGRGKGQERDDGPSVASVACSIGTCIQLPLLSSLCSLLSGRTSNLILTDSPCLLQFALGLHEACLLCEKELCILEQPFRACILGRLSGEVCPELLVVYVGILLGFFGWGRRGPERARKRGVLGDGSGSGVVGGRLFGRTRFWLSVAGIVPWAL